MTATAPDRSNGWEAAAEAFIADRDRTNIGVAAVAAWCRALASGAAVLDLGCGPGGPRSRVLHDHGLTVYALDASPSLARAYQQRFPVARVACAPAEEPSYFDRSFAGVLAWGLVFLLPEDAQRVVVQRVARALEPGGRLLFTAPRQVCTWSDLTTGRASRSLGIDAYRDELARAGLALVATHEDEGGNHYYDAVRGA
jgi:SAM-dependent methyltransferase